MATPCNLDLVESVRGEAGRRSVAETWRDAARAFATALGATVATLRPASGARSVAVVEAVSPKPRRRYEDYEAPADGLGLLLRGGVYPHVPPPGRR